MLPSAVGGDPTRLFGTYNTVATVAGSLGALAAAATAFVDVEPQRLLLVYAVVGVGGWALTLGLSDQVDVASDAARAAPLARSRSTVRRLAGLFALDSFGGGFVTQAFIAYWFTETIRLVRLRFGVAVFSEAVFASVHTTIWLDV